jgi:uncharacterized protein (TIGR00730 family)
MAGSYLPCASTVDRVTAFESLCVFCGSELGDRPGYTIAAREVGVTLAVRGIELVYGGGDIGLMGQVADAAMAAGGRVTGIIPEFMIDFEVAHDGLTELVVVDSMHERKAEMAERADAFIALPGGWGTLEELLEVTTWAQLRLHTKPVGLLDVDGFFSRFVDFLDQAVDEGFIKPGHRDLLHVDDDLDRLLDRMARAHPPTGTKWDGRSDEATESPPGRGR